jgi:hypothetical protein
MGQLRAIPAPEVPARSDGRAVNSPYPCKRPRLLLPQPYLLTSSQAIPVRGGPSRGEGVSEFRPFPGGTLPRTRARARSLVLCWLSAAYRADALDRAAEILPWPLAGLDPLHVSLWMQVWHVVFNDRHEGDAQWHAKKEGLTAHSDYRRGASTCG